MYRNLIYNTAVERIFKDFKFDAPFVRRYIRNENTWCSPGQQQHGVLQPDVDYFSNNSICNARCNGTPVFQTVPLSTPHSTERSPKKDSQCLSENVGALMLSLALL